MMFNHLLLLFKSFQFFQLLSLLKCKRKKKKRREREIQNYEKVEGFSFFFRQQWRNVELNDVFLVINAELSSILLAEDNLKKGKKRREIKAKFRSPDFSLTFFFSFFFFMLYIFTQFIFTLIPRLWHSVVCIQD